MVGRTVCGWACDCVSVDGCVSLGVSEGSICVWVGVSVCVCMRECVWLCMSMEGVGVSVWVCVEGCVHKCVWL